MSFKHTKLLMRLATHSGDFHADECTAISILRKIRNISEIIRTRDYNVINQCDIVVDVGTEYDVSRLRFDHHQPSFEERFDAYSATIMSSAGQVYKHFGKEYLKKVLPQLQDQHVDFLYTFVYHRYIEALDGNDNGVDAGENFQFESYATSLPARVHRLNACGDFYKAVNLCGRELEEYIEYTFNSTISMINDVRRAFDERFKIHKSGKVLCCTRMSYELIEMLEPEYGASILYIYTEKQAEKDTQCRLTAIRKKFSFKTRQPFPEAWRGLREKDLDAVTGVKGGIFVHRTGFLGIWNSREAAFKILDQILGSEDIE